MPCGYHVNQADGLITVYGSDEVTPVEALAVGRQILQDPDFHSELPHLMDLRDLTTLDRTANASKQLRDFVLFEYRPSVRACIAVVVNDSLDRLSLAALYHLVYRLEQIELFDNYEQALRWLMRHEFATSSGALPSAH